LVESGEDPWRRHIEKSADEYFEPDPSEEGRKKKKAKKQLTDHWAKSFPTTKRDCGAPRNEGWGKVCTLREGIVYKRRLPPAEKQVVTFVEAA
jgi:hypothetical protein